MFRCLGTWSLVPRQTHVLLNVSTPNKNLGCVIRRDLSGANFIGQLLQMYRCFLQMREKCISSRIFVIHRIVRLTLQRAQGIRRILNHTDPEGASRTRPQLPALQPLVQRYDRSTAQFLCWCICLRISMLHYVLLSMRPETSQSSSCFSPKPNALNPAIDNSVSSTGRPRPDVPPCPR